jgi:polar amino acid transport system ATP-binding protein
VAIIGRSGSGKSTLLRCINGLERPDSGTIEFDNEALEPTPRRLKALRREIGIVFQSYNLFPHLCVERNITLGPTAAKGIKPAAARELARKVSSSPAASNSASRSLARLRWSRAWCCSTRSPRPSILS